MKFYDTDTHEIFEATTEEFKTAVDNYQFQLQRDLLIYGSAPSIFNPICPSLKGHTHFVYKSDEEYAMIKFEDKFVHFRWTKELEGKKAFYADSLDQLEHRFAIETSRGLVQESTSTDYPFEIANVGNWKFIYFDPNYDCKVAYEQGKTIQGRRFETNPWMDIISPTWDDGYEYRIKPEPEYAVVIVSDKLSYVPVEQVTGQHVFFRGSQDECHNYIVSHEKFTECMIAYLNHKTIQVRRLGFSGWQDIDDPCWESGCEYRIKPGLVWTDLKLGDTVRQINGTIVASVTALDVSESTHAHVQIAGWGFICDTTLAEHWYKL